MKFDISTLKKAETVVSRFPEMKDYQIIGNEKNDVLLKIALYHADQESPFARIREFDQRHKKIFDKLGIDNPKLLKELIDGSNKDFSLVLFEVFRVLHNVKFSKYITDLNLFYNMSAEISGPLDKEQPASQLKNRMQISDMLDALVVKINKIEGDIFTDEKMKDMVQKEIIRISSYPEKYATSDPLI